MVFFTSDRIGNGPLSIKMGKPLLWALALSILATAGVVLTVPADVAPPMPQRPPISESGARTGPRQLDATSLGQMPPATFGANPPSGITSMLGRANKPLPETLPIQSIQNAARDPFGAPPPVVITAPPIPVIAPAISPVKEPQAPPFNYFYLGQMIDPAGGRAVLLGRGDQAITVAVGLQLEDGYVVQTLTDRAIGLIHSATRTKVEVSIPISDESSSR